MGNEQDVTVAPFSVETEVSWIVRPGCTDMIVLVYADLMVE